VPPYSNEQPTMVAIVTADAEELRGEPFNALLKSGAELIDRWLLVVRGDVDQRLLHAAREALKGKAELEVVESPVCGLSRARNDGLLRLAHLGLTTPNVIVLFPDVDCVFHQNARERAISAMVDAEIAVGPYAPSDELVDRVRWPRAEPVLDTQVLARVVASAGLLVRGNILPQVGFFDERLGVGAQYGAGEDTEFVLRAHALGKAIQYFEAPVMLHAYKPPRHSRVVGGNAVIGGYRSLFAPSVVRRAVLRGFVDRTRTVPRLRLGTGMVSARAMATYRPAAEPHVTRKTAVGGLRVSEVDPERCLASIAGRSISRTPTSVMAAHITALNSHADEDFARNFASADFAFVDGVSVAVASRLAGGPRLRKLATTDYAVSLLERLRAGTGVVPRVAIVGGEPGIAVAAGRSLSRSGLAKPVYTEHGFAADQEALVAAVRESSPDVLILGIGMPREAAWVQKWHSGTGAPLVLTCGGWLRLLAAVEYRAPRTMQRLQLEWLWRLVTDPRRTFDRYSQGVRTVLAIAAHRNWPRQ